jgi:Leucine-rich repeat (LRR) protein
MKQINNEKFKRTTRRRWVALMCGLCMLLPTTLSAQTDITAAFTDPNFKAAVYQKIGKTAPAAILDTDVSGLTSLDVNSMNISSLAGIEYFTGLQWLSCGFNQLTALDVSALTNLQGLYCSVNQLTALDVSGCTNLQGLYCGNNRLTALEVSGCTNLQDIDCTGNQLTALDVSALTNIKLLWCVNNQLAALNVSALTNLEKLHCSNNQLTALNVSALTNLQELSCAFNQLTVLEVSALTNMQQLSCSYNQLTALNVSALTNLNYLDCTDNQLTSLEVSGLTNLRAFHCSNNQLTALDLTGTALTAASFVNCSNNNMTSTADVTGWIGGKNWVFDPQNSAPSPSLTLSTSTLNVAATGGTNSVTVTSNIGWTAVSDAAWITVAPASGANSGTLTMTVAANPGYARTDTVRIMAGGLVRTIAVTQAAAQQVIVEPEPPVDNHGSIEVSLEIPVNELFSITFTLRLPAGFILDPNATALVSELLSGYRLIITPVGEGGWQFEIKPQTGLRSGDETAYQKVVNIAYMISPESVPAGDYAVKLNNVDLTMNSGETVHRDEITIPVHVTSTGHAAIDAATVAYANGLLTVNTPQAEQTDVYAVSGTLIFSAQKEAGKTTFDLSRLAKGVYIVTGKSGWTKKIIVN